MHIVSIVITSTAKRKQKYKIIGYKVQIQVRSNQKYMEWKNISSIANIITTLEILLQTHKSYLASFHILQVFTAGEIHT